MSYLKSEGYLRIVAGDNGNRPTNLPGFEVQGIKIIVPEGFPYCCFETEIDGEKVMCPKTNNMVQNLKRHLKTHKINGVTPEIIQGTGKSGLSSDRNMELFVYYKKLAARLDNPEAAIPTTPRAHTVVAIVEEAPKQRKLLPIFHGRPNFTAMRRELGMTGKKKTLCEACEEHGLKECLKTRPRVGLMECNVWNAFKIHPLEGYYLTEQQYLNGEGGSEGERAVMGSGDDSEGSVIGSGEDDEEMEAGEDDEMETAEDDE